MPPLCKQAEICVGCDKTTLGGNINAKVRLDVYIKYMGIRNCPFVLSVFSNTSDNVS